MLSTILSSWREHVIPSFRMNTKEKRVPMTAYNQRCYTYIPWTPSTFLRSNCLIGLSFSRNVRLDLLVCPELCWSGKMLFSSRLFFHRACAWIRQDVQLRIPGKRQSKGITDTLFVYKNIVNINRVILWTVVIAIADFTKMLKTTRTFQ